MAKDRHPEPTLSYVWLPYAVASIGCIVAIAAWYFDFPSHSFAHSIAEHFPWIILTLGISISILLGLAVKLIQVIQQRKKLYEIINQEFKKEIEERLKAEETKQNLERALLQSQKLQAIGTLAGGIAHDFNNLLYAIIGYVDMARQDVKDDSLVYKNLGKVLEAAKRGQELVARILAFGRRQHHDFSQLDLKKTMEGVLALLNPTIPASVTINYHATNKMIHILGNQTQIHQVMVNIINNAVDAMDGEGVVDIELNEINSSEPLVSRLSNPTADSYCKITITDTGHGMDQNVMERMFEPFFTTKEVGKGTGLGLATVHTIIQEHAGEIIVDSQLGVGTTFILLLPIAKAQGE